MRLVKKLILIQFYAAYQQYDLQALLVDNNASKHFSLSLNHQFYK